MGADGNLHPGVLLLMGALATVVLLLVWLDSPTPRQRQMEEDRR